MATTSMKSPLHNFPPTFFKWGSKTKSHSHHHRNRRSPSSPPPPPAEIEGSEAVEHEPEPEPESEKPWNLRPRKTTAATTSTSLAQITSSSTQLHPHATENLPRSTRLRGADSYGLEDKRVFVSLSKDEIEEDIYALTGSRPSRRPKKRPRNVQKQLDNAFPGLWLQGISAETYRKLDVYSRCI